MPEAIITYFGQAAKVNCDGKCGKAWGINNRPRIKLSDNEDDFAYRPDHELAKAMKDPGTYEGLEMEGKPNTAAEFPTKWCVRECERCNMSRPGESHLQLPVKSFDELVYNIPRTA